MNRTLGLLIAGAAFVALRPSTASAQQFAGESGDEVTRVVTDAQGNEELVVDFDDGQRLYITARAPDFLPMDEDEDDAEEGEREVPREGPAYVP